MIDTTQGTLRVFLENNQEYEDMLYDIENVLDLYRQEFKNRGLSDVELGSWEFTLEEKQTEDWSKKWKEKWTVTHVSDRIAIVPSWLEYSPKENEITSLVKPGKHFVPNISNLLGMTKHSNYRLSGFSIFNINFKGNFSLIITSA